MNNYMPQKWGVIIYPYPKPNADLVRLLLKLGHGWVIKCHKKMGAIIYPCPSLKRMQSEKGNNQLPNL